MSKLKIRNTITSKIIKIVLTIVFMAIIIIVLCVAFFKKHDLTYNLGQIDSYSDKIITTYEEYQELVITWGITESLSEKDFVNNNYLASYQEYDKCSEKKVKKVKSVTVDEKLQVTFTIFNKCGWCSKETVLYLIPISKSVNKDIEIEYEYDYQKELNCGSIALDK